MEGGRHLDCPAACIHHGPTGIENRLAHRIKGNRPVVLAKNHVFLALLFRGLGIEIRDPEEFPVILVAGIDDHQVGGVAVGGVSQGRRCLRMRRGEISLIVPVVVDDPADQPHGKGAILAGLNRDPVLGVG